MSETLAARVWKDCEEWRSGAQDPGPWRAPFDMYIRPLLDELEAARKVIEAGDRMAEAIERSDSWMWLKPLAEAYRAARDGGKK